MTAREPHHRDQSQRPATPNAKPTFQNSPRCSGNHVLQSGRTPARKRPPAGPVPLHPTQGLDQLPIALPRQRSVAPIQSILLPPQTHLRMGSSATRELIISVMCPIEKHSEITPRALQKLPMQLSRSKQSVKGLPHYTHRYPEAPSQAEILQIG